VAPSGRLDDQQHNLFFRQILIREHLASGGLKNLRPESRTYRTGRCVIFGGDAVVGRVLLRVDAIYGAGIYTGGVFGPMQGSITI
jgi:hypothetical protein